jgi:hypothetical protein
MSEIINTINSQLHVKLIKPLGLGLLNIIKKKVIKFIYIYIYIYILVN